MRTADVAQIARGAAIAEGGGASTRAERGILFFTIVLLPLQDSLPTFAGFSASYVMFGISLLFVVLLRPAALMRSAVQGAFIPLYALVAFGALAESLHPNASYLELRRIGEMVGGAVLIAAMTRDRKALGWGLAGFFVAGLWLGALLLTTNYEALSAQTASGFQAASRIREATYSYSALEASLNAIAAYIAMASAIALSLGLGSPNRQLRIVMLVVAGALLVATFLPLSRSGVLMAACAWAVLLLAGGGLADRARRILIVAAVGAAALTVIPGVALSRMSVSVTRQNETGKKDARLRLYTIALERFPEYILAGVGAGNYWEDWAVHNRLSVRNKPAGAHSGPIQTAMYWGLLGLVPLGIAVFRIIAAAPRARPGDVHALALRGISVCLLLVFLVSHVLSSKQFSLGIGLLVGSRAWIWPRLYKKPDLSGTDRKAEREAA